MSTEFVTTEEACTHPKLVSWKDVLTQDHCYQCTECGKEVIVPALTLAQGWASDEVGIIGLVFGDEWREKMLGGDFKRRWTHEEV